MYTLPGYGHMMADQVRMGAYKAALGRTVRPGSVVADLGAGPGIMSFTALLLGASRVYAIDPSETLEVARLAAQASGFQDRIECHRSFGSDVVLPERVDVIVSDLRGVLPAHPGNFEAVADARERFLKPGGVVLPQMDSLFVAVAEAPKEYDEFLGGLTCEGLDLSVARRMAANCWIKRRVEAEQLLTAAGLWARVDYRSVRTAALAGQITLEIRRSGTAHALSAWFDAQVLDDVGFSNAPGQPEVIYGQAFFPLPAPTTVERGDRVEVNIRADLVSGTYVWTWDSRFFSAAGEQKAAYHQSTFLGLARSREQLRKSADGYQPSTGANGDCDRAILELFNGSRTVGEIADGIVARFPGLFGKRTALDRVAALSARYSV